MEQSRVNQSQKGKKQKAKAPDILRCTEEFRILLEEEITTSVHPQKSNAA